MARVITKYQVPVDGKVHQRSMTWYESVMEVSYERSSEDGEVLVFWALSCSEGGSSSRKRRFCVLRDGEEVRDNLVHIGTALTPSGEALHLFGSHR